MKNPVSAKLMHISIESRSLTKYIHFHGLPHYICVFPRIPGNVTFFSKCSQRFIYLIDIITSKQCYKHKGCSIATGNGACCMKKMNPHQAGKGFTVFKLQTWRHTTSHTPMWHVGFCPRAHFTHDFPHCIIFYTSDPPRLRSSSRTYYRY